MVIINKSTFQIKKHLTILYSRLIWINNESVNLLSLIYFLKRLPKPAKSFRILRCLKTCKGIVLHRSFFSLCVCAMLIRLHAKCMRCRNKGRKRTFCLWFLCLLRHFTQNLVLNWRNNKFLPFDSIHLMKRW